MSNPSFERARSAAVARFAGRQTCRAAQLKIRWADQAWSGEPMRRHQAGRGRDQRTALSGATVTGLI